MYEPPFFTVAANKVDAYVAQRETVISVCKFTFCTPYTSTLHVATVKKEVCAFRIRKLFYSFW